MTQQTKALNTSHKTLNKTSQQITARDSYIFGPGTFVAFPIQNRRLKN